MTETTETEVGWKVAVKPGTPTKQEVDAMIESVIPVAKNARNNAIAMGLDKKGVFEYIKKEVANKYPYLAECIAVYNALGGTNASKSEMSGAYKIGSLVHHKLIGTVSGLGKQPGNKAKRKAPRSRASISRKFKAFKQVCDECGLIPGDKMCSILMDVTTDKVAEYRREMISMGYEFTASNNGWISVNNPRKAEEARLQRQIDDLTRQLSELRNK